MASNAFTECAKLALPLPTNSLQLQNSAAAGSLMKAMGIQACTTTDTAGGILPWVTLVEAHISIGCEQVAVLVQSIEQSQRAIQCTVDRVSQTSSVSVITSNNIILNISGHAVISCIEVDQTISLKIATNTNFGSEIRTSMASNLDAVFKSFASAVQNANKDAYSTTEGNKTATLFSTELQQTQYQGAFEDIIQESIQSYQPTNTFVCNITGYSMIGLLNPPPNLLTNNCLLINQSIIMQLNSSVIMDNVLGHVFESKAASDWSSVWIADQSTTGNETEQLANIFGAVFGIVILIACIGLVIFLLMKSGGNNSMMSATPDAPGQRGSQIGIALIIIGIILFIVGVALLAAGISTWGGGILLAVGVILAGVGGYVYWKAQQFKKTGPQSSTSSTSTSQS